MKWVSKLGAACRIYFLFYQQNVIYYCHIIVAIIINYNFVKQATSQIYVTFLIDCLSPYTSRILGWLFLIPKFITYPKKKKKKKKQAARSQLFIYLLSWAVLLDYWVLFEFSYLAWA